MHVAKAISSIFYTTYNYLRELEDVNGIEKNSLSKVRWIKPVARRTPQQTCGHAILSFSSPQAVNEVLANGIFVCQKKVYAEKCKKEPLRCLKCHRWGHMVCDCSAPTDTCGTCVQCHHTDTCMNTVRPHCVSCGIAGHASWDRTCPIFLKKCGELNDWLEDNSLPYFPTSEEWTQVSEPPKVVYIMPSCPAEGRSYQGERTGPAMTQMRL